MESRSCSTRNAKCDIHDGIPTSDYQNNTSSSMTAAVEGEGTDADAESRDLNCEQTNDDDDDDDTIDNTIDIETSMTTTDTKAESKLDGNPVVFDRNGDDDDGDDDGDDDDFDDDDYGYDDDAYDYDGDGDGDGDDEDDGIIIATTTTDTTEPSSSLASPRYVKGVVGLAFVTIILCVAIDSVVGRNLVRQALTAFLEWMRTHPGAGAVAFVVVYFVATLLCVPGALLTIGAGYVFRDGSGSLVAGVLIGTLVVFVGASSSSVVAFLLARYWCYDRVRSLSQTSYGSIFEALDVALSEQGFRIMCLLRLSPITPFVLMNYIAGVTTVKLSSYEGSIVCILPGTVLYVFLGASAQSFTDGPSNTNDSNSMVTRIAVALGIVFGILAIGLTSHYARKALEKEVDLVRSRLYHRTTSRRNRQRCKRKSLRRQRSRYRRRIDQKRRAAGTLY